MTRQPTPDIMGDVLGPVDDTKLIRSQLRYDYSLIPAEQRSQVQAAAVDIVRSGRRAQEDLMQIGQRLVEVKGMLEHGQFEDWCETEFQMSARTARNMMNVAKVFGGKSETVSVLSDSAMYLLAAPSTPEEARVEVIEQAQATGKSPTKAEVQETIRKHQPEQARYAEDDRTAKQETLPTKGWANWGWAAIWELEGEVRQAHAEFYREENELHNAASDMRAAARTGEGGFWTLLVKRLGVRPWRKQDLAQALHNVASQMEAKAAGTNFPAGTDLDPWAVAVNSPGSRQQRAELLARVITPFIREYRDAYGRNWQDLALNGNPAHTNSTFWGDIGKECKRRLVTVEDDTLKLAIKQAFAWLLADEPAKTQAPPTPYTGITAHTWQGYEDWTADDDAEYAALAPIWQQLAGTFNSINESRRITRWRVAARLASERRDNIAFSLQESARHLRNAERHAAQLPAPPAPVSNTAAADAERQAAVLTPDRETRAVAVADAAFGMAKPQTRNERIDALLHIFQGAVDALPEVGELTGHYTTTTALLRELNKVMQILKDNKIGGYKANE